MINGYIGQNDIYYSIVLFLQFEHTEQRNSCNNENWASITSWNDYY